MSLAAARIYKKDQGCREVVKGVGCGVRCHKFKFSSCLGLALWTGKNLCLSPNRKVSLCHFFFLGAENKIQKQKEVGVVTD